MTIVRETMKRKMNVKINHRGSVPTCESPSSHQQNQANHQFPGPKTRRVTHSLSLSLSLSLTRVVIQREKANIVAHPAGPWRPVIKLPSRAANTYYNTFVRSDVARKISEISSYEIQLGVRAGGAMMM